MPVGIPTSNLIWKEYYKDQLTRQRRNHSKKILDQQINEE